MASTHQIGTCALINGRVVVFNEYFALVLTPLTCFSKKRLPLLREALARVEYEMRNNHQNATSACRTVAKELIDFYELLRYESITRPEEELTKSLLTAYNKTNEFLVRSVNPFVGQPLQKLVAFIEKLDKLAEVIYPNRLNMVLKEDSDFYDQQVKGKGYIHWYGPNSDSEDETAGDVMSVGKAPYALRITSERKKRKCWWLQVYLKSRSICLCILVHSKWFLFVKLFNGLLSV